MTATIMPPDILKHLTPEFIAPVVGVLTAPEVSTARITVVLFSTKTPISHQGPNVNGRIFELGAGFVSEIRRQRAKGTHRLQIWT